MQTPTNQSDPITAHAAVERGSDSRVAALGGRLVRLRTAAGLGPDQVADAAGLDHAAYRSVEAGDPARLTYLDLLAIADALSVPAATVLADPL